MKKICLLSIVLFIVCAVNAQTEFSVPTPTEQQKYNRTKFWLSNCVASLITIAKDEGMSAEEFGKKSGEVFVPSWDENTEFEQFVNTCLFSFACMADSVQIIEQSNEKVVIMFSSLYPQLENQGILWGSSIEDYTTYWNATMRVIAVHIGCSYEMTWGEEGYRVVITQ